MPDKTCPSCGANLVVATTGSLAEKILKCEFCGYEEDLPGGVHRGRNVANRRDGGRVQKGEPISPHPPMQAIDEAMDAMGEDAAPEIREALERAQQAVAPVQAAAPAAPWAPDSPVPVLVTRAASRLHRLAVLAIFGCLGVALIAGVTIIVAILVLGR